MQKSSRDKVVAGLDIGSSKVVFLIGLPNANDGIDVVGFGSVPSPGLRHGVLINIEQTIEAIRRAKEEAELMAGHKADEVWLGIGGTHIKSFDSKGMVAIKNKETQNDDITRVIEAAKAVAVPADREVLHVLPREFKVDDQEGISDPIGMSGVRLEALIHIVTGANSAIQNIVKCTQKANLKVKGLVLQSLASSLAVLSEDEKKLGVAYVDVGAGTTDLIIYNNGSVAYTAVLPVGGGYFTHDIAVGLRTPQDCAEEIKKKHGSALLNLINEEETIEVKSVGGRESRTVLRKNLCEVIEPRAEEILNLIKAEIAKSNLQSQLGSGMVLSGGGSLLDGLVEMGEFIFDIPVRRGLPTQVGGLTDVVRSPLYSAPVGLLKYGLSELHLDKEITNDGKKFPEIVVDWAKKLRDVIAQGL
ncbi:MAG: cell division protein FtsA [Proteobacteria bacterium SG_bin7]|nr:MAG: cell division protein FtsA [Proteobacteria bacterium SG_bin7]